MRHVSKKNEVNDHMVAVCVDEMGFFSFSSLFAVLVGGLYDFFETDSLLAGLHSQGVEGLSHLAGDKISDFGSSKSCCWLRSLSAFKRTT